MPVSPASCVKDHAALWKTAQEFSYQLLVIGRVSYRNDFDAESVGVGLHHKHDANYLVSRYGYPDTPVLCYA